MCKKKLTDEEIKKALECCIKSSHFGECFENQCPLVSEEGCKVGEETLYPYTLDLINHLQEENERLKNILICFMGALGKVRNIDDIESISQIPIMTELNKGIRAEIKAEAYKEFAEKAIELIKTKAFNLSLMRSLYTDQSSKALYRCAEDIDNLLKEMVGDKHENNNIPSENQT